MNEAANRGGMIAFLFSLVVSVVFFGFIMTMQPGPIDKVELPKQGMTETDYINQRKAWMVSSADKIEKGKKLYEIHISSIVDQEKLKAVLSELSTTRKSETSELGMFKILSNGLIVNENNKFGYIPEAARWEITHYLRSLVPGAPTSTDREKETYIKYGL